MMGGTYNEPNTNLTGPETSIRNFVHGIGFQRTSLGAHPATAWQLDVFGHDPQFRGWRPTPADLQQLGAQAAPSSEGRWRAAAIAADAVPQRVRVDRAPSGVGLLTTTCRPTMRPGGGWTPRPRWLKRKRPPASCSGRWKSVALTRASCCRSAPTTPAQRLGHRYSPGLERPLHLAAVRLRDTRDFFTAVRFRTRSRTGRRRPADRDMNPIYDRQGTFSISTPNRPTRRRDAVLGAERFATFAALLSGASYPGGGPGQGLGPTGVGAHRRHHRRWSDQVYLDLLTGWRDAWELGCAARAGPGRCAVQCGWRGPSAGRGVEPIGPHQNRPGHLRLGQPVRATSRFSTLTAPVRAGGGRPPFGDLAGRAASSSTRVADLPDW